MRPATFALGFVLTVLCCGFQAPEGKDASCNNYRSTLHKCACAKAMMECRMPGMHAEPDSKCKTFCKPEACSCSGPGCASRSGR